jgi:hypothetical protein
VSLVFTSGRPLLGLALSVTLLFWVALSAFVLASRAYHDLRGWISRWSSHGIAIGGASTGRPDAV